MELNGTKGKQVEKLYTPNEVAELLQITYKHCLKIIRSGDLKAKKIGNKYRINKKDIDNFIGGDSGFELEEIISFRDFREFYNAIEQIFMNNPSLQNLNFRFDDGDYKIAIPKGVTYAKK
jgi:excisionase family DNA binding protein